MIPHLFKKTISQNILIITLLVIGILFRIYNLNWGSPYYFHPDERNIAYIIVDTKSFSTILFKSTFAYGNSLIIFAYSVLSLYRFFFHPQDAFPIAIIILRSFSALSSIILLFLLFIAGNIWSKKIGLLSLMLGVFSVGFIQHAHFGTFDMTVTTTLFSSFLLSIFFFKKKNIYFFYFSIICLAFAISTKLSALVFLPIPITTLVAIYKKQFKRVILNGLLGIILLIGTTLFFSPYYLTPDFNNLAANERGIVTGTLQVFYTQSFYNTTPVIFQFFNIYPFLMNPLVTVLAFISCVYLFYQAMKKKSLQNSLLLISFLLLFIPSAFLFTKWTRYMLPTLPFLYIMISVTISHFFKKTFFLVTSFFCLVSFLFSVSFFVSVLLSKDTRIEAAIWATKHIDKNSIILSEQYDLGILPFNSRFSKVTLLDLYDLEQTQDNIKTIQDSDYLVVLSQRLLRTRIQHPEKYPVGNKFYKDLFGENLGFKKVYESTCNIFCKIIYLNDPMFHFEETANVFDRPQVFIFKKQN